MRLSPLTIALSLALLAGCQSSPSETGDDAVARTEPATTVVATPESDALGFVAADQAAPAAAAELSGAVAKQATVSGSRSRQDREAVLAMAPPPSPPAPMLQPRMTLAAPEAANTEHYANFDDNPLQLAADSPVSTFSIDVDTGSYSNVRRMLMAGQRPPADAVRAEEMINYFDYGYAAPKDPARPFRVTTEIAPAPWNRERRLLQVGIQGYRVPASAIPAANLVFLVDTSGSMQSEDKLPLLKRSLAELVERLRPADRVAIVAYAGSAGLVLAPTPGDRKQEILAALERLESGGSTNGGEGLQLAYAMARQSLLPGGVNRVLLATDGDFNVGTVDQGALETLVADQRKSGVALTTLGFGTGNYNDAMAERLADLGNGNHAYVDSIDEGRKVLVDELSSTLLTIAEDVKIQVEFNPAVVAEYRLVGYENRALRREDFNNDRVDAGEIGAGHDVTALYEITLVGAAAPGVDPLRYRTRSKVAGPAGELAWLRLRYKRPGEQASRLVEQPVRLAESRAEASASLRWAAAVAGYADLLRGGRHVGDFGWSGVRALAEGARGADPDGHRAQFLALVDRARVLVAGDPPVAVTR
jgi:Ca-activated chloride channel family protein